MINMILQAQFGIEQTAELGLAPDLTGQATSLLPFLIVLAVLAVIFIIVFIIL